MVGMTREIFLEYQTLEEDDPFWTEWIEETIRMILEWCVLSSPRIRRT